jgi:amino acid adenylation domain-containing protein
MTDLSGNISVASRQQSIRAKCFHPSNIFIDFKKEEIEQSIPDRFEQIVRKYPNRLAVKTKDHELTYDQLNRVANRVARAILAHYGKGQEQVALLLEHDAPVIAAMIGVLKAGKVYVPLDPSYPRKRLAYMLEDSEARLLLTNQINRSLADALSQKVPVIDIEVLDSTSPEENLGLRRSPESLAFILYTSGSTGAPKGFSQTHCNVLLDTRNYTNAGHFCPDDRLLLVSSFSFADSVRTIYSALLNGASLYPFDIKAEGLESLANWLTENEITIYRSVPTVFRPFVSILTGEERFPKLRLIYLSGEPVYKKDVELYRKFFSDNCILVNRLGTGEALTFRWYFIDKKIPIKGIHVPVGFAVPDKDLVLLGEVEHEADGSRVGEIGVRSCYLSPGYWKRPDLTQAAFLPNPDGGDNRIYRTGDIGRMLPDGCLVHLGRKDHQVKIRGYRIEVSEIEMALLDFPAVKEAVVVAREDRPSEQRLVAYLVPARKLSLAVSGLRRFLNEKLPEYMIPSAFVLLDALPLTPNGKVDRRALPAPSRARPELANPFVAPRTPVEKLLAGFWAELLGLERVGIHDNFLELGGHSLLATQIISRVLDTLHVEVPLRSLFETPTVEDMAVVITENMAKKTGDEELARMLAELESLSDEEAQRRLANERAPHQLNETIK